MWIFKHKFKAVGSLEHRHDGFFRETQCPGLDVDETFSPVVKPVNTHTVLSLAVSKSICQLILKNAFLHGVLTETVYCSQPPGFEDSAHADYVCWLNRSLYGLKQAPRAWYSHFGPRLFQLGFVEAKSDTCLFIYHHGDDMVYVLLFVDDIILTASSDALLCRAIASLFFPAAVYG